jgi:hypothetical protein
MSDAFAAVPRPLAADTRALHVGPQRSEHAA